MKRQHPIHKMHKAIVYEFLPSRQELVIARHVKPLLDVLSEILVQDGAGCACKECKLLAAWKEPLR